jgi:electron transfer DM13
VIVGVAGLLVGAVGLAVFEPWKLWSDTTVVESAPAGLDDVAAPPVPVPSAAPVAPSRPAAPRPVTVASGRLISHEHATSGSVRLIRLADRSYVLRLENLDTSDGPDVHVWLTDAPVLPGSAGWRVFDDGAHLDLGTLKGNHGSQNYPVPAGVDPSRYRSVSLWCDRFNVSFGAAALS